MSPPPTRKILRNTAGVTLIVLGVIGLFLPILQGVLFILLGAGMLDFPGKDRLVDGLRANKRLRPFFRPLFSHRRRRSSENRAQAEKPCVPEEPPSPSSGLS